MTRRSLVYTALDLGVPAAVINNHNLSERLLKLHGRWKSDIAKDMYILEETQNRLSVTCNLGLKV